MLAEWLRRVAATLTSRVAPGSLPQLQERQILRLLERRPMNTRELERRSGVPRDQVYEILGRLYERRAVLTAPTGTFWSALLECPRPSDSQRRETLPGCRSRKRP